MILVRTPAPAYTESFLGYVLRVSEANGYDTPWHILKLAGLIQGQMQSPRFPVGMLARILGKSPDALAHLAYSSNEMAGSHYMILGHSLGKSAMDGFLRLRQPAFCPHCVREKGFVDAFWDLSISIACPDHNCPPLRHCPACAEPIRWFRPGLLRCRCGAGLEHVNAITTATPTVELMRLLRARLHNKPLERLPNTAGFPVEFLKLLPLLPLLKIIDGLGRHHLQCQGITEVEASAAIAAAVEPLSNWPSGYHHFLTNLGARFQKDRPAGSGLRIQFQPFYESMFKNRSSSRYARFLRDEFVNFGLQHWGNGIVDNKLLRLPRQATERRYISKTEYASRFGLWKPSLDRMIADGTIASKTITTGKGLRVVVDLKHTQPPIDSQGIVTDREAAKKIGLPVSVLQHLRHTGVFGTKPRIGFEQSWHVDDVEEFLHRGLALVDTSAVAADTVTLNEVMRIKLRSSVAKGDIVSAIFDGRLSVIGHGEGNLAGLLLNRAEVDKLVLDKRRETEGDTYSIPEVATQTGLHPMVISTAIELGFFATKTANNRTRVMAVSVSLFNQKYLLLSKIAQKLRTSTLRLWRMCQKHGFKVVELPRSNGEGSQPVLPRNLEETVISVWEHERLPALRKAHECRQRAQANALQTYLRQLRDRGEPLPGRAGVPNKAFIARACGFNRDVLYNNAEAISLLDTFAANESMRTPIAALRSYLEGLHQCQGQLPLYAGQPNKNAIARACGFHRNVLYVNAEAISLLNTYFQKSIN